MSRPPLGTAPIKCANRNCGWTGLELDLVTHPDDIEKDIRRNVCPKCHCDEYTFPRRKKTSICRLISEVTLL